MLGNKKKGTAVSNGQALNTIIGRGSHFEGKLTVDNSVRIDGVFKGELVCTGELTISQSGEVDATLQCKDAYIDGVVNGTVHADKVRLDSQSRFTGDVYTDSFSVSEGAIFHGSCSMENHKKESESLATGASGGAAAKPEPFGPRPQVQKGSPDGAAAKPLTSEPRPQTQKK